MDGWMDSRAGVMLLNRSDLICSDQVSAPLPSTRNHQLLLGEHVEIHREQTNTTLMKRAQKMIFRHGTLSLGALCCSLQRAFVIVSSKQRMFMTASGLRVDCG